MRTIAFTDWHELSFNGKTFTAQITIVSGKYYLTLKDPTRIFLISSPTDSKIDMSNEISLETAKEIGIII